MKNLAQRLWSSSPKSLTAAVSRRYRERGDKPGWHTVAAGPLASAKLYLATVREGGLREMRDGTFDQFFYDELSKHVDLKGKVCWEIGAHIGYHALSFAALGAEVLAFEPNEHNARAIKVHLERNPELGKHIRLLTVAVADQVGEMSFAQSDDMTGASSGSHLQAGIQPLEDYEAFATVKVPVTTIDTVIQGGERKPDVIKIDVEGAEALVLRGGKELLQTHRPLLLMEVHHILLMMEVQALLRDFGYELRSLDDGHTTASRCFIIASPSRSQHKLP
ncbi:MAG TPA: FkbM family methyltransferase [Verrucomicrobiae bacterium]|jgi:FkbM family methyltransferase|nr:FkbM family methyltransferase [Verrucomicrobiae bacterium]